MVTQIQGRNSVLVQELESLTNTLNSLRHEKEKIHQSFTDLSTSLKRATVETAREKEDIRSRIESEFNEVIKKLRSEIEEVSKNSQWEKSGVEDEARRYQMELQHCKSTIVSLQDQLKNWQIRWDTLLAENDKAEAEVKKLKTKLDKEREVQSTLESEIHKTRIKADEDMRRVLAEQNSVLYSAKNSTDDALKKIQEDRLSLIENSNLKIKEELSNIELEKVKAIHQMKSKYEEQLTALEEQKDKALAQLANKLQEEMRNADIDKTRVVLQVRNLAEERIRLCEEDKQRTIAHLEKKFKDQISNLESEKIKLSGLLTSSSEHNLRKVEEEKAIQATQFSAKLHEEQMRYLDILHKLEKEQRAFEKEKATLQSHIDSLSEKAHREKEDREVGHRSTLQELTHKYEKKLTQAEDELSTYENHAREEIKSKIHHLEKLTQDNSDLREQVAYLEESNKALVELKKDLFELKIEKTRLSDSVNNLSLENTSLVKDLHNYKTALSQANERLASLEDVSDKYKILEKELKDKAAKLVQIHQTLDDIQTSASQDQHAQSQALERIKQQKDKIFKDLELAQKEIAILRETMEEQRLELRNTAKNSVENLASQVHGLVSEKQVFASEIKAVEDRLVAERRRASDLQQALATTENANIILKSSVGNISKETEVANEALRNLREKNTSLGTKLEQAVKQIALLKDTYELKPGSQRESRLLSELNESQGLELKLRLNISSLQFKLDTANIYVESAKDQALVQEKMLERSRAENENSRAELYNCHSLVAALKRLQSDLEIDNAKMRAQIHASGLNLSVRDATIEVLNVEIDKLQNKVDIIEKKILESDVERRLLEESAGMKALEQSGAANTFKATLAELNLCRDRVKELEDGGEKMRDEVLNRRTELSQVKLERELSVEEDSSTKQVVAQLTEQVCSISAEKSTLVEEIKNVEVRLNIESKKLGEVARAKDIAEQRAQLLQVSLSTLTLEAERSRETQKQVKERIAVLQASLDHANAKAKIKDTPSSTEVAVLKQELAKAHDLELKLVSQVASLEFRLDQAVIHKSTQAELHMVQEQHLERARVELENQASELYSTQALVIALKRARADAEIQLSRVSAQLSATRKGQPVIEALHDESVREVVRLQDQTSSQDKKLFEQDKVTKSIQEDLARAGIEKSSQVSKLNGVSAELERALNRVTELEAVESRFREEVAAGRTYQVEEQISKERVRELETTIDLLRSELVSQNAIQTDLIKAMARVSELEVKEKVMSEEYTRVLTKLSELEIGTEVLKGQAAKKEVIQIELSNALSLVSQMEIDMIKQKGEIINSQFVQAELSKALSRVSELETEQARLHTEALKGKAALEQLSLVSEQLSEMVAERDRLRTEVAVGKIAQVDLIATKNTIQNLESNLTKLTQEALSGKTLEIELHKSRGKVEELESHNKKLRDVLLNTESEVNAIKKYREQDQAEIELQKQSNYILTEQIVSFEGEKSKLMSELKQAEEKLADGVKKLSEQTLSHRVVKDGHDMLQVSQAAVTSEVESSRQMLLQLKEQNAAMTSSLEHANGRIKLLETSASHLTGTLQSELSDSQSIELKLRAESAATKFTLDQLSVQLSAQTENNSLLQRQLEKYHNTRAPQELDLLLGKVPDSSLKSRLSDVEVENIRIRSQTGAEELGEGTTYPSTESRRIDMSTLLSKIGELENRINQLEKEKRETEEACSRNELQRSGYEQREKTVMAELQRAVDRISELELSENILREEVVKGKVVQTELQITRDKVNILETIIENLKTEVKHSKSTLSEEVNKLMDTIKELEVEKEKFKTEVQNREVIVAELISSRENIRELEEKTIKLKEESLASKLELSELKTKNEEVKRQHEQIKTSDLSTKRVLAGLGEQVATFATEKITLAEEVKQTEEMLAIRAKENQDLARAKGVVEAETQLMQVSLLTISREADTGRENSRMLREETAVLRASLEHANNKVVLSQTPPSKQLALLQNQLSDMQAGELRMRSEISSLQFNLEQLNFKLESTSNRATLLEGLLEKSRAEQDILSTELYKNAMSATSLKRTKSDIEVEGAKLKAEVNALGKNEPVRDAIVDQKSRDIKRLQDEIEQMEKRFLDQDRDHRTISSQLEKLKLTKASLETSVQAAASESKRYKDRIADLQRVNQELLDDRDNNVSSSRRPNYPTNSSGKTVLDTLKEEIEELASQKEEMATEIRRLEERVLEEKKRANDLQRFRGAAEEQVQLTQVSQDTFKREIESNREIVKQLKEQNIFLTTSLEHFQGRLNIENRDLSKDQQSVLLMQQLTEAQTTELRLRAEISQLDFRLDQMTLHQAAANEKSELYKRHLDRSKDKLAAEKAIVYQSHNMVTAIKRSKTDVETELVRARSILMAAEHGLSLEEAIESNSSKEVLRLQNEVFSLEQKVFEQDRGIKDLEEDLSQAALERGGNNQVLNTTSSELNRCRQRIMELETMLEKLREDYSNCRAEFSGLKLKIFNIESKNSVTSINYEEQLNEKDQVIRERDELIETLTRDCDQLLGKVVNDDHEFGERAAHMKKLMHENKELCEEVNEARTFADNVKIEIQLRDEEIEYLSSQLEESREQLSKYTDMKNMLRRSNSEEEVVQLETVLREKESLINQLEESAAREFALKINIGKLDNLCRGLEEDQKRRSNTSMPMTSNKAESVYKAEAERFRILYNEAQRELLRMQDDRMNNSHSMGEKLVLPLSQVSGIEDRVLSLNDGSRVEMKFRLARQDSGAANRSQSGISPSMGE